MMRVNLMCSSITSTTRSLSELGFIRPHASNSCHAFGTDDWFVVHGIRIHRASRRSSFTALNDWEPPLTCNTAHVRPCVGRTEPVFSGSQSIWFLKAPVMHPCISGETHTCPSDHSVSDRSSWTFGRSSSEGSRTGSPDGLYTRTSAPISSSNLAHSCASLREKEDSRSDPYNTSSRGLCVSVAPGGTKLVAPERSAPMDPSESEKASRTQSSPGPEPGSSSLAR
mmetsp:Transcript_45755/g.97584  ORF Transcript_45755/g.97584 Transcript_45755/m.97584 type:complete len:225 (+) Transcript_45755:673-1347(+)